MKIEIRNGRLIDPRAATDRVTSIFCATGRVLALDEAPDGWHPNKIIDAAGFVVCPGLIDGAFRFGFACAVGADEMQAELSAACAGGVTGVVCPPDTDPILDEPGLVEMLKARSVNLGLSHVYPLGALTVQLRGEALAEMGALYASGCVGVSQADVPIADTQVIFRAMQYAATLGYSVSIAPRDAFLGVGGVAHDGEVSTRLGLVGVPSLAETLSARALIAMAQATDCALHLSRLSCAESLAVVRRAKERGTRVTCDVDVAHLHLIDVDIGYYDCNCHVVPPLRSAADRAALRRGLADGTIDAVVSAHTPMVLDAKQVPFAEAQPGMSTIDILLPLLLKWASEENVPLLTALARVTDAPARLHKLPGGHLAPGAPADICIFDPSSYRLINPATLRSPGKNCAFLGYELPGTVRYTLVSGKVVYDVSAIQ